MTLFLLNVPGDRFYLFERTGGTTAVDRPVLVGSPHRAPEALQNAAGSRLDHEICVLSEDTPLLVDPEHRIHQLFKTALPRLRAGGDPLRGDVGIYRSFGIPERDPLDDPSQILSRLLHQRGVKGSGNFEWNRFTHPGRFERRSRSLEPVGGTADDCLNRAVMQGRINIVDPGVGEDLPDLREILTHHRHHSRRSAATAIEVAARSFHDLTPLQDEGQHVLPGEDSRIHQRGVLTKTKTGTRGTGDSKVRQHLPGGEVHKRNRNLRIVGLPEMVLRPAEKQRGQVKFAGIGTHLKQFPHRGTVIVEIPAHTDVLSTLSGVKKDYIHVGIVTQRTQPVQVSRSRTDKNGADQPRIMVLRSDICYAVGVKRYQQFSRITGVGAYVPERRVHNDELAGLMDTSDEWIYTHTGIRYRHVAADEHATSDLAVFACRRALDNAGLEPEQIDLILVATSTPDYIGLPSTACVVQEKLGIREAGAMDLVAACTGFVYGVETARTFVAAGAARHVLVVGSEIYSRIVNWKDRTSAVLFGDGAGAVVVSATEDAADESDRLLPAILGSRGSGAEDLCRLYGGTRHRYIPGETAESDILLQMDGRKVYNFAVGIIVDVIRNLLSRNGLTFSDVKYVVPHQANRRIITAGARRGDWDEDRFYVNMEEYANTSAASIPIALNEMQEKGLIMRGDLLLCVGFGSGLTYGGNLIYW